jgi:hypothetical protein
MQMTPLKIQMLVLKRYTGSMRFGNQRLSVQLVESLFNRVIPSKKLFTICILLLSFTAKAQLFQELAFEKNFRIYPGEVTQTEVFITRSPVDDDLLFASCNTLTFIPFFVSEGVYVSNDGGFNWSGNDTCTGEPVTFHGGDPGIAIDKDGTFILTRLGRPPFTGLFAHYSEDNGQTWSFQVPISTDDLERASITTDAISTSAFYGRTYAVWIKFAQPFPLMFSFTDDGSKSWSEPVPVNNPALRSAGGDVTVGPGGEVYACWAGVSPQSPFSEQTVGFASSVDGGMTWDITEDAFEVNGITGIMEQKQNIRVNGLPAVAVDTTNGPRRGWIYIVTGQKERSPAGDDPDIILNRSIDGGLTWSEAIRVNQDEINNGRIQYFPSIHIDRFGSINIVFYDDRNTTSDSTGVFLARSEDGGDTWKEWEVSDHNFKPVPIGGLGQGYQGDNIDMTSTGTHLWPVWMDNSSGVYQVWTAPIDFSTVNNIHDPGIPPIVEFMQTHPNPFSGFTTISYKIQKKGVVRLALFDAYGREVALLENEMKHTGEHRYRMDGGFLTPGLYFIQLSCGDFWLMRKMIKL